MSVDQRQAITEEIEKHFEELGEIHFDVHQREVFIDLLTGKDIQYCLETGFCSGTSSATILSVCKPKKMICVDNGSHHNFSASNGEKLKNQYNFELVVGSSVDVLTPQFLDEKFPNGIDFYHVDGGHEGEVPRKDLDAVINHLNDDFIIVVDDYLSEIYNAPDVIEAVNGFVEENSFDLGLVTTTSGKGMAVIRNKANSSL